MQPGNDKVHTFRFPKAERICSRTQIENLLQKKQKVFCYPFKCFYAIQPATESAMQNQMLVSAPKRLFKHAVDRNRIKRLTREAYRLHHPFHLDSWTKAAGVRVQIIFHYVAPEILPYNFIEDKIIEILHRLKEGLSE